MFVYLIINQDNNKTYIGKTTRPDLGKYLKRKFSEARNYKGSSYLFNAMKKYPPYVWSIHPLISTLTTNEELCFWEQVMIAEWDSQNPEIGYNICRGGEGFTGPHTEEAKKKNSVASRAMWQQPGKRKTIVSNMKKVDGKYRIPGAKIGGRWAAESGQLDKIRPASVAARTKWRKEHPEEDHVRAVKAGRRAVESGQLAKARQAHTPASLSKAGQMTCCKRWNVNRGKPCVCGNHL